jgi:hypothetical protein
MIRHPSENGRYGLVITLVVPYLVLVAVHIRLSWATWQPTVFMDELGYLGNARFLAGAGRLPNLQGFTFYHFGYSLLIAPAFWISANPLVAYKAVVVINGLLLSLLYFCYYYVLRRLFAYAAGPSAAAALVGSLYPAYLLQANMAWSESALILFYGLSVATFGAFLIRRSVATAVVFGFITAYCYAIHPRALPLVPVAFLAIIVLAVRGRLPKLQAATALAALIVTFASVRAVNHHLKELGWAGTDALTDSSLWAPLFAPGGLKYLLIAAAGQLLYLCQASYGLFTLGLLEGIRWLRSGRGPGIWTLLDEPPAAVVAFLMVTSLGILFASSVIMVGAIPDPVEEVPLDPVRGDHLIYGRYNEMFVGLYIVLGLASLQTIAATVRRSSRRIYGVLTGTAVLTLLVLGAGGTRFLERDYYMAVTIWGVFPVIRLVQFLPLSGWAILAQKLVLGIVSLVSLAVFWAATRRGYRLAAGVVGLCFLASAAFGYYGFVCNIQQGARSVLPLPDHVAQLGGISRICYDMSYLQWPAYGGYQYLLPDVAFEQFHSDKDEIPSCPVVVSGSDWKDADRLGARLVFTEKDRNNALWVLPGEVQDRLPPSGPFLNRNVGCERVDGVPQSGFYRDGWRSDGPVRWTNGAAKLSLPLADSIRPRTLHVQLASVAPRGSRVRLVLNGQELCNEFIEKGPWSRTFDLNEMDLGNVATLELLSDTFPRSFEIVPKLKRQVALGVLVQNITFADH